MKKYCIFLMLLFLCSCNQTNNKKKSTHATFSEKESELKLIVVAPEHFHASLLQKNKMKQVADTIFVYGSDTIGLKQYLSAIESYNARLENPTSWHERVYVGNDFMEKMTTEKKGDVVILAGNNRDKTKYIAQSIDAGLSVLSDKPMAINKEDFESLKESYSHLKSKGVLLYDMMTERYDLLNIIERKLINDKMLFGELQKGTTDHPAIYMESKHHFFKEVSGIPLIRPAWYYDIEQQGEGIADVTTHLIDLLLWKCFPDQILDYNEDVTVVSASHWPTKLSLKEFAQSTRVDDFPDYLKKYLKDNLLHVFSNGTINFQVKDLNVALKVVWDYQAPQGEGDTFNSVVKGTKAILQTSQNREQNYVRQLYIKKADLQEEEPFMENLEKAIEQIQQDYPFVSLGTSSHDGSFLINIPVEYRTDHESHFKSVAERFFHYLKKGDLPEWENANTLVKYFITTTAVTKAND